MHFVTFILIILKPSLPMHSAILSFRLFPTWLHILLHQLFTFWDVKLQVLRFLFPGFASLRFAALLYIENSFIEIKFACLSFHGSHQNILDYLPVIRLLKLEILKPWVLLKNVIEILFKVVLNFCLVLRFDLLLEEEK